MATLFSHALGAGTLYKLIAPIRSWKTVRFCIIGSLLPDADVIAFVLGIPYEHMLGHRGFTHSILFGVLYALFCLWFYKGSPYKIRLFLLFFVSIMSHGILDMLTNGGLGVGLFIPFSAERFFFPVTPIEVSPIGKRFFSERGLDVLMSEAVWVLLPCLGLLIAHFLWKKLSKTKTP